MNETSSPIVGEDGKVKVKEPPVVLQNTPCPAAAVKLAVLTACHDVPPASSSSQDKTPPVVDFKTYRFPQATTAGHVKV